jgi:DNA-directed RNA polymerase specialized sigma subunit
MPEVVEAHSAYKQADKDALKMRFRARAVLGLAIDRERKKGSTQPQIAAVLGVSDEQVRRYEAAYRAWLKEHSGEPLG